MTEDEMKVLHEKIKSGAKVAIAQALERHRKLGELIAIWRDGEVVVLNADQINSIQEEHQQNLGISGVAPGSRLPSGLT